MSEIDQMVKQYEAVEAIVRTVCLIENTEDDEDARYICLGEDGDPIIEAETLGEAVQSIIRCWNWCEGAWHKVQDEVAALTAQLAERPAERDALTAQREEIARLGFVTGYVRAEGERQFRETGFTPFPAERDAYELRAVGAWEVLRELPAGARPPVFDLLAAPTEG